MDSKNSIWSRRPNTSNLSLSTNSESANTPRDFSSLSRRNGATSSHGRSNPFAASTTTVAAAAVTPGGGGLASPIGTGGSSAFGLGSGAFAAFGSAKTPKSTSNPFEMAMGSVGTKTPVTEKSAKEAMKQAGTKPTSDSAAPPAELLPSLPLQDGWVFWTRPPISKANGYIEYEKTLHPMAQCSTALEFWTIYRHIKPPSQLPFVTDIHLFKKGIRPIWEDDENKRGGKWVLRLKKGVADRYWEEILMACIGGQLCEDNDEVNGAVISVRNGEDIISIWTASTVGKVLKIRESMKSLLKCPPETRFEFKTHDESMTQRAAVDEQRRERANNKNNNNNSNHHDGEKRTARHDNHSQRQQQPDDQRS